MKVVIMAGGMGTRLQEETVVKPKPMVEVGGQPILWHIMHIYAAQGFNEFAVACGYKADYIKNYFLNYYYLKNDLMINLREGKVEIQDRDVEDWKVHLVDTGLNTQTGGRLKRLRHLLQQETFMMTYGDGVADIDLDQLLRFHRSHGKLATVTAVRPPSRFGGLSFEGDRVSNFVEKSQIGEGWINGGFFVLEPKVLDYIKGDETLWEVDPMERLASEGQLMAYRHSGFWQCMDNVRDLRLLESLWAEGHAPWKVWK